MQTILLPLLSDASWFTLESHVLDLNMTLPAISVVVCTYNRASHLAALLRKLEVQELDSGLFELLIVDNSDSPGPVQKVLESARTSFNCRVIRSAPPGLSRARNIGAANAHADLVAYIDDDAEPSAGWLKEIVRIFGGASKVAAVGGAILPIWPVDPPVWLSGYAEAALSILDRTERELTLSGGEHLYGTNMAFRRAELLEAGGFDENLGRKGSNNLLSSEEIAVQEAIRTAGHSIVYSSTVVVFHRVHKERVDQGWLRRRLAWQGVSDALQATEAPNFQNLMANVAYQAGRLGIDESLLRIFVETDDPVTFQAQLELLRNLVLLSLASRPHIQEREREAHSADFRAEQVISRENQSSLSGLLPAPVASEASFTFFFDPAPGHNYLYDTYAEVGPSHLLAPKIDVWDRSTVGTAATIRGVREVFFNASEGGASVCIITLDPLLYRPIGKVLLQEARKAKGRVVAILHKAPSDLSELRTLSELSFALNIAVLTDEMARDLTKRHSMGPISVIPHHPTISRVPQNPSVPKHEGRTTFGLVGEVRPGKGLETFLSAVANLSAEQIEQTHILLAGKCSSAGSREIQKQLAVVGVSHTLLLRDGPVGQYSVLTDLEYADAIRSCDVGVLLYGGTQREVMSGVLPSFVHSRVPIIATKDSYVGEIVGKHRLGVCVSNDPREVAHAMSTLLVNGDRQSISTSTSFDGYRTSTTPEAAVAALAELLTATLEQAN